MRQNRFFTPFVLTILILQSLQAAPPKSMRVDAFKQEVSTFYSTDNGLPSADVQGIVVTEDGAVYATTAAGVVFLRNEKWQVIEETSGLAISSLVKYGNKALVLSNEVVHILEDGGITRTVDLKHNVGDVCVLDDEIFGANSEDLFLLDLSGGNTTKLCTTGFVVRQMSVAPNGEIWFAADDGLFLYDPMKKGIEAVYPRAADRSWAPVDVGGVSFDSKGRLWFGSPQGAGCLDGEWTLYTGKEGLPYNMFSVLARGENGVIWFGTNRGAIRYDGKSWEYRQGRRWLPDDDVRDIAITKDGHAWFATGKGIGVIKRVKMTLSEKAKWYENEIDRYHRRTPFQYVLQVSVATPGDKSEVTQHDSDNDGLWTSMYGAGQCYAYAATKDPKAKERAVKAFEAMLFLAEVTQGGEHSPPPGFVARTILPTLGRDPNVGRIDGDIQHKKERDSLWKIFEPRWPVSKDGKWYWKTDTSSDELDGHYFFYARYYDLVAETETEKQRVRKHVRTLTDHLIKHDFMLVDHDGKPTRWARFNPDEINLDKNWYIQRGLNSLEMLSYLVTTAHITGDDKYRKIAEKLIKEHTYLQNLLRQKFQRGIGTGNQSDDEMAFMGYYNYLMYETDPAIKSQVALSMWLNWGTEYPEMNPFFNFAIAATCSDLTFSDPFGTHSTAPTGDWLEDAVETLVRFPMDRFNWRHTNSHRLDIIPLPAANQSYDDSSFEGKGYRVNGKVIPVDECYFDHWNRNPWSLDTGGNGRVLGDGTVFLLPYYMGLYHGFITE